jgi:hypothetical protein
MPQQQHVDRGGYPVITRKDSFHLSLSEYWSVECCICDLVTRAAKWFILMVENLEVPGSRPALE